MFSQEQLRILISHLLKKWLILLLALLAGALIGYFVLRSKPPVYTANISFVLSTDPRPNAGLYNLAAQLGFDAISSNPENIFSGENIIELFKSRQLIGSTLLAEVDKKSHLTLLNLIARDQFGKAYAKLGPFGTDPDKFSLPQKLLYRRIITYVGKSFIVFKKEKNLIVYVMSMSSNNPDITYHTANLLLDQTSKYFIETKTKVFATGVRLLQHEADSLEGVISKIFSSTASINDRTYDLNPTVSIQRSGSMFNQAKAAAYDAAYAEVMRNLEIAKINLQKETPLYRIIDQPDLPLLPEKPAYVKHVAVTAFVGVFLMTVLLIAEYLYKSRN